jgi:hypothetical protein
MLAWLNMCHDDYNNTIVANRAGLEGAVHGVSCGKAKNYL